MNIPESRVPVDSEGFPYKTRGGDSILKERRTGMVGVVGCSGGVFLWAEGEEVTDEDCLFFEEGLREGDRGC